MAQAQVQSVNLKLTPLHKNQLIVAQDSSRYRIVAAGRRWGKSIYACNECTFRAIVHGYLVWWVVPFYKNAIAAWRELTAIAKTIPGCRVRKDDWTIDYPGGGAVSVISAANPDNVRGAGLGFVVFDEAAYAPEKMWGEVVQPALLDHVGGALFISTPNGYNWFYHLYRQGKPDKYGNRPDNDFQSFHFTTYDNPTIADRPGGRAAIDALRKTMTTKKFEQEIMAVFSEDAMGVFRGWRDCLYYDPPEKPWPAHVYAAGCDWGRSHDFTAISVWDVTTASEVYLDHFNQVGWEHQRNRIAEICKHWNVSVVYAEENAAGEPNIEALQLEGYPVMGMRTTNQSKAAMIQSLSLAFEQKQCKILDAEFANEELQQYEQHLLPVSGLMRYSAPEGGFDDTVIARALGWYAISGSLGDPVSLDW